MEEKCIRGLKVGHGSEEKSKVQVSNVEAEEGEGWCKERVLLAYLMDSIV